MPIALVTHCTFVSPRPRHLSGRIETQTKEQLSQDTNGTGPYHAMLLYSTASSSYPSITQTSKPKILIRQVWTLPMHGIDGNSQVCPRTTPRSPLQDARTPPRQQLQSLSCHRDEPKKHDPPYHVLELQPCWQSAIGHLVGPILSSVHLKQKDCNND